MVRLTLVTRGDGAKGTTKLTPPFGNQLVTLCYLQTSKAHSSDVAPRTQS